MHWAILFLELSRRPFFIKICLLKLSYIFKQIITFRFWFGTIIDQSSWKCHGKPVFAIKCHPQINWSSCDYRVRLEGISTCNRINFNIRRHKMKTVYHANLMQTGYYCQFEVNQFEANQSDNIFVFNFIITSRDNLTCIV